MEDKYFEYKPKQSDEKIKELSAGGKTTKAGSVTERYRYEREPDKQYQYKFDVSYLNPTLAAQSGMEKVLFGGGPATSMLEAQMYDINAYQNYLRMNMPQVKMGKDSLVERTTEQSMNTDMDKFSKEALKQELDMFDKEPIVYAMPNISIEDNDIKVGSLLDMMRVGTTKAGDTRIEFTNGLVTIPRVVWDKLSHWDILKKKFGDKWKEKWQRFKKEVQDYLLFDINSEGDIMVRSIGGNMYNPSPFVRDVLGGIFTLDDKKIEQIKYDLRNRGGKDNRIGLGNMKPSIEVQKVRKTNIDNKPGKVLERWTLNKE